MTFYPMVMDASHTSGVEQMKAYSSAEGCIDVVIKWPLWQGKTSILPRALRFQEWDNMLNACKA
jgi:hypothetical protein